MRSDGLLKHLAICSVIAVVFYVTVFGWLQHLRTAKGPWTADFRADTAGRPALLIFQTNLNISETIAFPGQNVQPSNFSRTIIFEATPPELPFGQLIYQDPTFLPGTVTLHMFGHQVEFLPRVLTIDKQEYPWKNGAVIEVR
jgi:hypothetical protein